MLDTFPFDKRLAADLLADTETTATVLHMIILAAYGDEVYGSLEQNIEPADPIELWLRIKEDFSVNVPESNENKVNALMLALSTEAFYDDPLAFISISNALYSGDLGDLVNGALEDLTMPEMLWGIYEVELNRGDSEGFAIPIDRLIDEIIKNEAEDNEELEETEVVPYYEKFVAEMRDDMLIQMRMLGVDEMVIKKILKEDLTPVEELNEQA
jgi:hypothetical protein